MAEAESLSNKDLFLLIVGFYKLKDPPGTTSANKYWLKDGTGALRETVWNFDYFVSPQKAWDNVQHRDWLIARIARNVTSDNQDFSAISEPMLISFDVLTNEFKPNMKGETKAIEPLVFKDNYWRSFLTTLSLGLTERKISDDKTVRVFGAGMRRRMRVWVNGTDKEHALQADIEFFMPFYVIPSSSQTAGSTFPGACSICAGIALSRANGDPIGADDQGDLAAVRFNLRVPFTPDKKTKIFRDDYVIETKFDPAVIEVQKRAVDSEPAAWEPFEKWKDFVAEFCAKTDSTMLLNAPMGPLLLEKISDGSSVKDILKSQRGQIKEDFQEVEKELSATLELLKSIWKDEAPEKPDPENLTPHSGERKLGSMLDSLGLLSFKSGKYSLGNLANLTIPHLVSQMFVELDGFPLYVSGLKSEKDNATRFAITLASQAHEINPKKKQHFGIAGFAYNIPIKTVSDKDPAAKKDDPDSTKLVLNDADFTDDESILIQDEEPAGVAPTEPEAAPIVQEEEKPKKKSTLEIRLHLGKWFDGDTLDDNWFRRLLPPVDISKKSVWKRRVPLPGFRFLPYQRELSDDDKKATFDLALRGELLSMGFDFKGTTKDGLTFLQFNKGPLAYLGLGAVETRIALLLSAERVAFGIGVKLKDLRLSFGPKEKKDDKEKEEKSGDEIIAGLQDLLADDWEVVPAPKKTETSPKTRMSAKKKDKFSISVGYLSPLYEGSHGTLDIQLYDEKGKRGGMVWIPIERRSGTVYVKHIGIGLKGVENVDLSKGLSNSAQLTVALTGGLRWPLFELGFIGARLSFPLKDPGAVQFGLDGLDVSLKIGAAVISGSFLKSGIEYAGSLTIELPKFSIGAMGFYGSLSVFSKSFDSAVVTELRQGTVHKDLRAELDKSEITPVAGNSVRRGFSDGQWEFPATNGKRYTIVDDDGKLNVLSPDKTLFIYGTLTAGSGGGIRIGPIEFTGLALGFGLNRRFEVPAIDEVAEFPLVKMVMGEGGYQKDDTSLNLQNQLGAPVKDPVSVLAEMKDVLPPERGQYFICGGVRFTIASTVDCFALIVVQFGNDFEFALLGLARFRQPRDLSAKAICYVEMQILMSIKPSEGSFKLQALLTGNSWIINKDCKLTGGFALFAWFDGEHKDDFVITLGGYHPRFRRPDHYPIVPRLGLNWHVDDKLTIKGGVYLAVTPSCCMLGAKLEASFQSGRVSAWFTAYLDVIVAWSPLHYEAEIGISLRVEAALFLTTLNVTIAAMVKMWGPPVGGVVSVDLTVISIDILFGTPREKAEPDLIKKWPEFCRSFLKGSGTEQEAINIPVPALPITLPNLAAGRNNLDNLPKASGNNGVWKVRGDELELAASAVVPVTTLNVGTVKISSPQKGVPERGLTGKPLMINEPVAFETGKLHTTKYPNKLGVHPMGKTLTSALNVTIVRDDGPITQPVDLTKWTIVAETNSLPAALWDPALPDPKGPSEPTAKLIPNCITGIKRLRPPSVERGPGVEMSDLGWQKLTRIPVSKPSEELKIPAPANFRNIQAAVAKNQARQAEISGLLASAGFHLAWKPAQAPADVKFRELQAEPLVGAVANQ